MRHLKIFEQISLDGCFCDDRGDIGWAHKDDEEWAEFTAGNASGDGALVFGRITYEMMASHWPTPRARAEAPAVAEKMNRSPKIVFSRTLERAGWEHTRIVRGDVVEEMRRLKQETGPDLVILGSGTLVSPLAAAGMIDEYQLVLNPVALGRGRSLFADGARKIGLKLRKTRRFENGNVVLWYAPT